jgi:hypothetical protein
MPIFRLAEQWLPIKLHCIAMNDLDIGKTLCVCTQHFNQTVVDFDGDHICACLGEGQCKRAEAGAYFKYEITTTNIGEARDFVHGVGVDNEVLPEGATRRKTVFVEHRNNFGA